MAVHAFEPFTDCCPFCFEQLARGARDDGKCGHEEFLAKYPHLRFNAADHLTAVEMQDSIARFKRDRKTPHEWPV